MFFERNGLWTVRGVISALDTVDGFCNPKGYLKVADTGYFLKWIKKVVSIFVVFTSWCMKIRKHLFLRYDAL